ncbi:MAG: penicillin-binding protein [Burkholderiales bacterium RIFCSPLOWO2_02_FULL_57_36]|nr:MAG: penicillin-binding protein [Burkholderiales bacterium RIFCSPLOWO2_02_FULL_57_36]
MLQAALALSIALALCTVFLLGYVFLYVKPNLPALDAITDYQPKIPLRIFTADHVLIGEFGEERRSFVPIGQFPDSLKKALLAAEDDDFYEHGGVDLSGVLRAALVNLRGGSTQGGSTITMQVARNFFLTREKTYARKINEIMLAYKIEAELSKDKILELYMNQIYLGQRAYGFDTAANTYFGKSVADISLAQAAMLAGLPKAPSAYNPVVNPKRAAQRQHHILKRMRALHAITPAQYDQAMAEKLQVRKQGQEFETHAEYAAEMVRQVMYEQYKEETYTRGFNVYTTLFKADQDAAYEAVRRGVMDYERRHGYRGPEAFVDLPGDEEARQDAIDEALAKYASSGELRSAVVTAASAKLVRADMLSGETIDISGAGLRFAAPALSKNARTQIRLRPGAVIRVIQDTKGKWAITQLPQVAAAFIALNAHDGSYRAMVGGFDFNLNKFDRVRQAWRQPGSSIKPFIYSAALEKGFSPGTVINDAPLAIDMSYNGSRIWEPQNDDGNYDGPVSMRTGLIRSKNVVSVRLVREIGPEFARDYLSRFGFDADRHPANLTISLGTGAVTPLQMAGAYAVFSNGGYQVNPYLIQKITDARGTILAEATPAQAGQEAARVLDPRNAFAMDTMLRDVTRYGTAAAASQKLGRTDLAGKTGTTNDSVDGWFAGYSGDVVAVAWMGYDEPKSLGSREFGSTLGLPIWIDYMRAARRGKPVLPRAVPGGLVQVDGDWMYREFANAGAVRSIGLDESFSPMDEGDGIPDIERQKIEKEKKRIEDLYFGNNIYRMSNGSIA